MRIHNRPIYKNLRQQLRNNATKAESILWWYLQHKRFFGFKFRRQHGIGRYILDFYCPDRRLGIELDGDIHDLEMVRIYDQRRQADLEAAGIHVLRFSNEAIYHTLDEVLQKVHLALTT